MGKAIVIALLAFDLVAQQTRVIVPAAPDPGPAPRGTGAITGTVTDAGGRPIAGAIVALENRVPGQPRRSYSQVTTPKGRFAFVDLPAADTYFLTTGKTGYLDGGYNRPDPRGQSAPIALADGQWIHDLHVTMALPGSISGIVSDERGEPIVGAYVRVLPQVLICGRTQWLAGSVAVTDDRGAYRIAGLGPGKYLVSVPSVQATLPVGAAIRAPGAWSGTSMADLRMASDAAKAERLVVDTGGGEQLVVGRYTASPISADGRRTAYPITFYPNVSTPAAATPVDLRTSEDRAGVDFSLQPVRTSRVSGVVQGPPDAVGNLLLRLLPLGLEEFGQGSEAATTVTFADGRFTFVDVPEGSYILEAKHSLLEFTYTSMSQGSTALPVPVPFATRSASGYSVTAAPSGVELSALRDWSEEGYWGQLRVDVASQSVDDIVLPLRRPVSLSGRVEWAPGDQPPSSVAAPMLEPADGRRSLGLLSPKSFSLDAQSRFTIEGLMAGEYVLRFPSQTVESIIWDGQDYTGRPFDGSGGRDIEGVVVTLTTKSSFVAGAVTDGTATMATSAAVIVFPLERERWSGYGLYPTRLRSVLTTTDGHFRIDGLPRGDYNIIAVSVSQERAWIDPAFLASAAARASHLRIDRSDSKIAGLALSLVK
jgi:hypothetical protein